MKTPAPFSMVRDFTGRNIRCSELSSQTTSSPGVVQIYEFNFSFDTPNLNEGVPVLDMNPGDSLLDAWTLTTEEFNGTNLYWDVGTFNPNAQSPTLGIVGGWWGQASVPQLDSDFYMGQIDYEQNDSAINSISTAAIKYGIADMGAIYPWQIKFLTFCTLKFVVSQDYAMQGGPSITVAPSNTTQGKGTLYLQVARAN